MGKKEKISKKSAPAAGHGTPSPPRMDTLWGPRAGPERIWAHDWENSVVDALGERISQTVAASRDVIERSECERGGQAAAPVTSVFFLVAVRLFVRWSCLGEVHRTIQLRSPGLNALSLRRYQTARILHASLHRWLD